MSEDDMPIIIYKDVLHLTAEKLAEKYSMPLKKAQNIKHEIEEELNENN
jgi:hypothetical protein